MSVNSTMTQAAHGSQRPRGVRGASLIEVLVAMVIASVGLLALAGINAASMRYTKMSQYRATAAILANDIGERMRANRSGFVANAYNYTEYFSAQAAAPSLPSQKCDKKNTTCTVAELAALDLALVRVMARDQLPEGALFVLKDTTAVAADVWVAWRDPSMANADEAPKAILECPDGLSAGGDASIRCSFFRINL